MKNITIIDIIFCILMLINTIMIVLVSIYIISDKCYISTYTDATTKTEYLLSNYYIIERKTQ